MGAGYSRKYGIYVANKSFENAATGNDGNKLKLHSYKIWGMLATMQLRILSSYLLPKNINIRINKLQFHPVFCVDVEPGLSH
jgi:hypothetical protein